MKIEELLARLEENANAKIKPIAVEVEGIGTLYVRKRTVLEFERMASLRGEVADTPPPNGIFAPSLVRLLCDEDGNRFPPEHEATLAALLARQPEDVFHAILAKADGEPVKKAEELGN